MKIYATRKNNQEWIVEQLPFLTKLNYGTFKDYDCKMILRYWIYDRTGILFFIRCVVGDAFLKGNPITIVLILSCWYVAFTIGFLLGKL